MKNITRQKNPDYDKIRYQKIKELRKEQNKEWYENNKDRVRELNEYHRKLRKDKLYDERKKLLDYDNYEWYVIPEIKRPYYINKNGVVIDIHFRKLKTREDRFGYVTIALDKKPYMYHRVVASVFIPNPDNKKEINHKNGIKNDNRIENLEWVTRSENIKHSFEILGKKSNLVGWKNKKNTEKPEV